MNATIASNYRRPLIPTLSMILALAAIVIAVIALATAPSDSPKVITRPAAATQVVPAPNLVTPPPAPAVTASGHAAPAGADCRSKRYGTMC